MTQQASELLQKALSLSEEERAELAGSLIESLDAGVDEAAVYFRNVSDSNAALTLFGHDLTSRQQELVLKIFETLRFGGPVPKYVLPPPPPPKNAQ
jgi:hypothetical protein